MTQPSNWKKQIFTHREDAIINGINSFPTKLS